MLIHTDGPSLQSCEHGPLSVMDVEPLSSQSTFAHCRKAGVSAAKRHRISRRRRLRSAKAARGEESRTSAPTRATVACEETQEPSLATDHHLDANVEVRLVSLVLPGVRFGNESPIPFGIKHINWSPSRPGGAAPPPSIRAFTSGIPVYDCRGSHAACWWSVASSLTGVAWLNPDRPLLDQATTAQRILEAWEETSPHGQTHPQPRFGVLYSLRGEFMLSRNWHATKTLTGWLKALSGLEETSRATSDIGVTTDGKERLRAALVISKAWRVYESQRRRSRLEQSIWTPARTRRMGSVESHARFLQHLFRVSRSRNAACWSKRGATPISRDR